MYVYFTEKQPTENKIPSNLTNHRQYSIDLTKLKKEKADIATRKVSQASRTDEIDEITTNNFVFPKIRTKQKTEVEDRVGITSRHQ